VKRGGEGPILLIEDDPDIRGLLRRRLAQWPYEVVEAASGELALELAQARRPALVVLDIVLPGIDGWEVLRRLRGDPELADVPVVVVSIVDDPGEDDRPAVQAYLQKPFHAATVNRVFARLLGSVDSELRADNAKGAT
jgi:CheY-like chemotaxis protein